MFHPLWVPLASVGRRRWWRLCPHARSLTTYITIANCSTVSTVGEQTNLQINPPRSRSHSPTCVSEIQVNSKKHVGHKKESLHNKRKVTFKQDGPHILPRQTGHYGQQNILRQ